MRVRSRTACGGSCAAGQLAGDGEQDQPGRQCADHGRDQRMAGWEELGGDQVGGAPGRASPDAGMTAGALARFTLVTSGAVTNRLDRLVAKGYITREVDPANRRSVLVALTPAGRELIDRAVAAHVANERRILAALDHQQQDELAATLRTLLLSLGDEVEQASKKPPADG
ncbi:MarR family transcriptional regulator [Natronosporangium hydrolyticum]|uniref:MarR family transcriptional regulator n=1 Tax=Natronosporangium hydrolyticum TaxID=2811111 RepID=A0A895YG29_9ACTN|nr:MarR family transcriptional regulator [Natronosporangium hydrolyticum]